MKNFLDHIKVHVTGRCSSSALFRGAHINFLPVWEGVKIEAGVSKRALSAPLSEESAVDRLPPAFFPHDELFFIGLVLKPFATRVDKVGQRPAFWTSSGHAQVKVFALSPSSDAREAEAVTAIGQNPKKRRVLGKFFEANPAGFCQ